MKIKCEQIDLKLSNFGEVEQSRPTFGQNVAESLHNLVNSGEC